MASPAFFFWRDGALAPAALPTEAAAVPAAETQSAAELARDHDEIEAERYRLECERDADHDQALDW